jgi:hypothetical protein
MKGALSPWHPVWSNQKKGKKIYSVFSLKKNFYRESPARNSVNI